MENNPDEGGSVESQTIEAMENCSEPAGNGGIPSHGHKRSNQSLTCRKVRICNGRDTTHHNMIGIKKVPGGNMRDSFLVNGVTFEKTFSYVGFEQQPKKFLNPKILLLNIEMELKS